MKQQGNISFLAAIVLSIGAFTLEANGMIMLSCFLMTISLLAFTRLAIVTEILKYLLDGGSVDPPPKDKEPIPKASQQCGAFFHI